MENSRFTAIYEDNVEQARIILSDPDFTHISKNTLTLDELDEICIQCRILEGISSESISPLHYAAMKNSDIAILLIDYYNRRDGNNNYALNDRNENGKTALHYAS